MGNGTIPSIHLSRTVIVFEKLFCPTALGLGTGMKQHFRSQAQVRRLLGMKNKMLFRAKALRDGVAVTQFYREVYAVS